MKYKVGDYIRLVGDHNMHLIPIGEVVKIHTVGEYYYWTKLSNLVGRYILEDDCVLYTRKLNRNTKTI